MYTLAHVVSIWREAHKLETIQKIFLSLCTHVHAPFSTHLSQKKIKVILKVPAELIINWGARIDLSLFRGI